MSTNIKVTAALYAFFLPLVHTAPAFPPPGELTEGFINANITLIAGGGLPNSSASVELQDVAITGLQLLASLENIEAFFYSDAIRNITSGLYSIDGLILNDTLEVISKIAAQEEVHVATVGAVLWVNQAPLVPPCKYQFPATTFDEFLGVTNLLTSANFGGVIGMQEQFYESYPSLFPSISSILAVEARHYAFLRILHGLVPNPSPFDTGLPIGWPYNIGLQYTVPGSCPVEVPLPTYPQLYTDAAHTQTWATAYPQTITFTWDANQAWVQRETGKQVYAAWVNLFNEPLYTPVTVDKPGSGTTSVPKDMQSVAYVALTTVKPEDFTNLQDATHAVPLAISIS